MLKPIYVKMPITIDEKHEYHRKGFRVIDERFKPINEATWSSVEGDGIVKTEIEEAKPRQRRRRNAAEDEE